MKSPTVICLALFNCVIHLSSDQFWISLGKIMLISYPDNKVQFFYILLVNSFQRFSMSLGKLRVIFEKQSLNSETEKIWIICLKAWHIPHHTLVGQKFHWKNPLHKYTVLRRVRIWYWPFSSSRQWITVGHDPQKVVGFCIYNMTKFIQMVTEFWTGQNWAFNQLISYQSFVTFVLL